MPKPKLTLKPLRFLGGSRDDLLALPRQPRHDIGAELMVVQLGGVPSDYKPFNEVGAGTHEIRVKDASGIYRCMYVAKFQSAVYVLHAFQKKAQKTSRRDIDIAIARYRLIPKE
jgi:phage-related protein